MFPSMLNYADTGFGRSEGAGLDSVKAMASPATRFSSSTRTTSPKRSNVSSRRRWPGLIEATAYFFDVVRRAGLRLAVSMSQISVRKDSKNDAARDHWIAERLFDASGVPVVHLRPTFFSQRLPCPHSRTSIVEQGS